MSNQRNFTTEIPNDGRAAATYAQRDESAMMHGVKSLGEYYPIAKKFFENNSLKLGEEVRRQLQALEQKNVATRDASGFIITGLLDLTKFGLTPEQAQHQNAFLAQERAAGGYATPEREAMLHAVKELGPDHLHEAIDAIGLDEITKRARKQLDALPPEFTKKDGLIVIGLLDLKDLGLTPVQAEERSAQIDEMRQNSHRYLTTSVSPFFNKETELKEAILANKEAVLANVAPTFEAAKFAQLNGATYEAELTAIVQQIREKGAVDSSKLLEFGFDEKEVQGITSKLSNKTPSNFVAETTPVSQGLASVANPVEVIGEHTKAQSEKPVGHEGSLLNL